MNTVTRPLAEVLAMPAHPVADLYPMLDSRIDGDDGVPGALWELVRSIEDNGVREPIVLWDGQLLDGRNRLAAAKLAGLAEVPVCHFDGTEADAVAYVFDLNNARRHMSASQRALTAARMIHSDAPVVAAARERMVAGSPALQIEQGRVAEILAREFNVSPAYIYTALKLLRESEAVRPGGWFTTEYTAKDHNGDEYTHRDRVQVDDLYCAELHPALSDEWPEARKARIALRQIDSGTLSLSAYVARKRQQAPPAPGPYATAGDKVKPEPQPEYGVVTGADTSWRLPEREVSYEERRTIAVEVLIRSAKRLAETITCYALTDGDIASSAEQLTDDEAAVLGKFFGAA